MKKKSFYLCIVNMATDDEANYEITELWIFELPHLELSTPL